MGHAAFCLFYYKNRKSDWQCFGIIFIKLPALWKHRSVPPGPLQGSFACSTQAQYPGSG